MSAPPPAADPEKFIIGHGAYTNLRTARPYHDARVFRLDPTPMPIAPILLYNLIFASASAGLHYLIKHAAAPDTSPWLIYAAPFAIGLLTCLAFTAIVYYSFAKAQQLGPWLVYDKSTGRVTLPREGVSFDRGDIVHLQYITTKRLNWPSPVNNERLSEINLITSQSGHRQRWPLLRSIANIRAFDALLQPLLQHTNLPIMRVQDQWLGWTVTEEPYHPSGGS